PATKFSSSFQDSDNGDVLVKIKIASAPNHGSLSLDGQPVAVGREIAVDALNGLKFTPEANWSGTTSFGWQGSDGQAYSDTATLTISLDATNHAPVVRQSTVPVPGTEGQPVAFTSAHFSALFSDSDGNALTEVKITSLPEHGTLNLGETEVTIDQVIPASKLADLQFVPDAAEPHWYGLTDFGWQGSDGTIYSNKTTMEIEVSRTSPSLDYASLEATGIREGESVVLTETMLAHQPGATAANKVDPDTPASDVNYALSSVPDYGELLLEGKESSLAAGDRFTLDDIQKGLVKYQHDGSEELEDGFSVTVSDENGEVTAVEADFAIVVTPVNDAPTVNATQISLSEIAGAAEDGTTVVQIGDLLGQVNDPEGDVLGIAVVGTDGDQGTWQFSLDGTNWRSFDAVSNKAATLLDDSDWIRFEPGEGSSGTAKLDFLAWDHAIGKSGDTGVNTNNNSSHAFSDVTVTASIDNSSPHEAPSLPTFHEVFSSGPETDSSLMGPIAAPAPPLSVGGLLLDDQHHSMMA
ncbi:MAG: hypothetical protein HQL60_02200, partial [Magnetococcales bacterium]|nr:hypothetical protein [Magnetococcales bacterium]